MEENNTNNPNIETTVNNNINEKSTTNNTPQKDRKGFAIAALVLGIVSIVLACVWFLSIPCGILAIIFGALSLKSSKRGFSIAGIITGIIGTLALIIILILSFGIYIFNNATDGVIDSSTYDDYSSSYYRYD